MQMIDLAPANRYPSHTMRTRTRFELLLLIPLLAACILIWQRALPPSHTSDPAQTAPAESPAPPPRVQDLIRRTPAPAPTPLPTAPPGPLTLLASVPHGTTLRLSDPHTLTLLPGERHTLLIRLPAPPATPQTGSPGFTLLPGDGYALIADVLPDTPAQRAGLQPGDAVLSIDSIPLDTLTPDQLSALLTGPATQPLLLRLVLPRDDGTFEEIDALIERSPLP